MKLTDNCEAFDYAIALWYWLSHHYSGQGCDKYTAMSKIDYDYKLSNIPSIDFDEESDCCDEAMIRDYYADLNESNWRQRYDMFCEYMDNEWETGE